MKPQCNTSADCLRELARVMDKFGIKDSLGAVDALKMVNSEYVKYLSGQPNYSSFPQFSIPSDWKFAIAEVEGKPVFPDSELRCKLYDQKLACVIKEFRNNSGVLICIGANTYRWVEIDDLTWKPATVFVELPYDYVVERVNSVDTTTLKAACKTALEKLHD